MICEEEEVADGRQDGDADEDHGEGRVHLPDRIEWIDHLDATLGGLKDEQRDVGDQDDRQLLVVGLEAFAGADTSAIVEQVLADEDHPKHQQRAMEDALANVAQEGHEFNVHDQVEQLHRYVQLRYAQPEQGERLLQQIGIARQLFQSIEVPNKCERGDHREHQLQCQPDLGEATVLSYGHHR